MTTAPEDRVHVLKVTNRTGDTQTQWRVGDDLSTAEANRVFDEMVQAGFLAYTVPDDGSAGDVLRTFDPQADTIVITPPLVGG